MNRETIEDLRGCHGRGFSMLKEARVAGDASMRAGRRPAASVARGTPLRLVIDGHAAATGVDPLVLRADVALAAAVEAIAANCGDAWRDLFLGGRFSRKQIVTLAGKHADRQRFALASVAAGGPPDVRPKAGPPTFETVGWYEVPSRLARAAGIVRQAVESVEVLTPDGPDAGKLRPRFGRVIGLTEGLRGLLAPHVDAGEAAMLPDRRPPALPPAAAAGSLVRAAGLVEKNLRDLPRLVRESGVDQRHAGNAVRYLLTIERSAHEALARLGGRPSSVTPARVPADRRVATHRKPDVDALVACWLAERYLFPDDPVEIVFVPRDFAGPPECPYDAVLDVGRRHDPGRLLFDHKPPAVADRHSTCATRLLWEHLRSSGREVGGLAGLVGVVWDGDSSRRRPRSAAYRESRAGGLHAEVARLRDGSTDAMLYAAVRLWLDCMYFSPRSSAAESESRRGLAVQATHDRRKGEPSPGRPIVK